MLLYLFRKCSSTDTKEDSANKKLNSEQSFWEAVAVV